MAFRMQLGATMEHWRHAADETVRGGGGGMFDRDGIPKSQHPLKAFLRLSLVWLSSRLQLRTCGEFTADSGGTSSTGNNFRSLAQGGHGQPSQSLRQPSEHSKREPRNQRLGSSVTWS